MVVGVENQVILNGVWHSQSVDCERGAGSDEQVL